jgi:ribose transport system substrate-binding protein
MRGWLILMAFAPVFSLCGSCEKEKGSASGGSGGASSGSMKIAVIPKGTTQEFWQSVKAGAEQAGREAGAQVVWKGPLKEDDRAQQIAIVEQFTSEHVSAIVLAPLDDTALIKPVQDAVAKKIPVIIFDSALRGEAGKDFVSFVATDNRKGGSLGGEALVKLLGGKGKVILFRYNEGSASTTEREEGFADMVKRNAGLRMLVDNEYAGVTAAEAQKKSMNMLDRIKEADGIFCPNESSTFGMLLTLRQAGLAGKVKLVGFDASPPLIEALRSGEVNALVVQNPMKIGVEGVKAAVATVRGETVPPRIDTGVRVLTKGDLEDAEVRKLLGI